MIDVENSEQWLLKKWGIFSASQIFHLTIGGTFDKKTNTIPMFGPGAISYVKKIAREACTIFNLDENPMSYAMKMGKVREPLSADYYIKAIGMPGMKYYGGGDPLFHHFCPDSGASPDLVMWKDEANFIASFGCELKNPSGDTHFDYLLNIKNAADLKRESIEYYTQCQFSMLTFRTDLWHWCSHNEYFPDNTRLHLIEIPADKNFQNDLEARLYQAVKMKRQFIEQIKNM